MEMVKLTKDNRTIERNKVDYENNKKMWKIRGWVLAEDKPKPKKIETPIDQTIVEEKPKVTKTTTKKAE